MKNKIIKIKNKQMLSELVDKINNNITIRDKYRFVPYDLKDELLKKLEIDPQEFNKKYYYFDSKRNLHISESEENYFLVSTSGIIMYNDKFRNEKEKIIFAFESQGQVLEIILEKIEDLIKKDDIYDIDSYNYNYLMKLTTGISNNLVLFLELLAKSYIKLNGEKFPKNHKLVELLKIVKKIMFKNKHNDTKFHLEVYKIFKKILKEINADSDDFIEQYIKYNESIQLEFIVQNFDMLKVFIDISIDSIMCLSNAIKDFYFEQGVYDKIIIESKTRDEEEKNKKDYQFLVDSNL